MRRRELPVEPLQKYLDLIARRRLKFENPLNFDVGKPQACNTRAKCLADVFGGGAWDLIQHAKNRFVIGILESMSGQAVENFGAGVAIDQWRADCPQQSTFDFCRAYVGFRFIHPGFIATRDRPAAAGRRAQSRFVDRFRARRDIRARRR